MKLDSNSYKVTVTVQHPGSGRRVPAILWHSTVTTVLIIISWKPDNHGGIILPRAAFNVSILIIVW